MFNNPLGNPDEYTISKTAVIDVYFSRLRVYPLDGARGGLAALHWRAAIAVPGAHAGACHAGRGEYSYLN